jgi:hypothetical protein
MDKKSNLKKGDLGKGLLVLIIILGVLSVEWGYDTKSFDAQLVPNGTPSGMNDLNTGKPISYSTIEYYNGMLEYMNVAPGVQIGNPVPMRRLIHDINIIRIDEINPTTKIIEYRNVFGGVVSTELIIGRDIELKMKT